MEEQTTTTETTTTETTTTNEPDEGPKRYWVTPVRFTEEWKLKWRVFGPLTKSQAKAVIKHEIEKVNSLCAHIRDDDGNQKTFAGNTTMKGLVEWITSGKRAHIEDWKPIGEMKIKKISPNVLTLDV